MPSYEAVCCGKRFEDNGGKGPQDVEDHIKMCPMAQFSDIPIEIRKQLLSLSDAQKERVLEYLGEEPAQAATISTRKSK